MKIYYKVIHLFFTRQADHIHCFEIGIYDSKKKALDAIDALKSKEGFCLRPDKFYVYKAFRFRTPKLLNRTFWGEGFTVYTYKKSFCGNADERQPHSLR